MQRIEEIDFLKGFLIVLVISFHLVYIGDLHLYAKRVVYTFHMPGFLFISGYLMNIRRSWMVVMRIMLHYAVPYVLMESGYIMMASVLPIREHLDDLTVGVFFDKLLLHPLGPYWYLQTLIICGIAYAAISRLHFLKPVSRFVFLGIIYYLISEWAGILTFACSMYFLAGGMLRYSGLSFTHLFQSSSVTILAFVLLAIHPQNLQMDTSGGVLMTMLVMSAALFVNGYIGVRPRRLISFLGRKTMPLFLFSPIFTFLCKPLVPFSLFDRTGLTFLLLSLVICISGSLAVEWLMDKIGLSRYFYATVFLRDNPRLTKIGGFGDQIRRFW
jgi:fucose 4-O-acetylase-like acetyltransferase